MTIGLFIFGTLLDADLRALVAGGDLTGIPATMSDHAVHRAADADLPALVPAPGQTVRGLLLSPDADQKARLHFYQEGSGFQPGAVTIDAGSGPVHAIVYLPVDGVRALDIPWQLSDWQASWGPVTKRAALESMGYFGQIDGATLRARIPMIFARADAALRAARDPMPHSLRSDTHRDRIAISQARVPYTKFFSVNESDLTHPTFRGGTSENLNRAAFVMCDAVTILPYDPTRDRVMLVEQFRFGPFARGDLHPWVLEPIAGRIDPTETPEAAARREAEEEAHLALGDLIPVGSYYPSPGAVSEYLYTFVGLADLPDDAAGLGGKADEGEDIRAHILAFDHLVDLVASGEVDSGPLLTTLLWLQRERGAGRFA